MTDSESQTASAPRKRRWLQFSLRTLAAFIVFASVGMSCLAVKMQGARKQSEAVEAIRRLGGAVQYDHEWIQSPASGPDWLRKLLGKDLFNKVVYVWLSHAQINDAALAHLNGLPQLQFLAMDHTQVGDAGLAHLKPLAQLQALWLEETQITDAGLAHLEGMAELRQLDVDNTQITDAGLAYLRRLTQLRVLSLNYTQVTDAGLTHLEGMTQLHTLALYGTQVSDDGVRRLQQSLPIRQIAR